MEVSYDNMMTDDSRNMMIKGKRQRSPLALTTTLQDSDDNNTPTNSIDFIQENDHEQDMANCLILLAQGQGQSSPPNKEDDVYECKTCNRGFSSFQALGGHRASHKKPPKPNNMLDVVHTTLSLQLGLNQQRSSSSSSMKVNKVHECSVCGAEFGSGQALGGHMRRHRSTTNCGDSSHGCQESKKPKLLLSLDLNLPAPDEDHDHRRETKFPFQSQDQLIVFSNSSLVHCHF